MKEITAVFSVGTQYLRSTVEEEITIEVDEDATEEEIMAELYDYHEE